MFRPSNRLLCGAVLTLTFALTLTARVWGITRHFWMLGDQIRDWDIALHPFSDLPLVGPPTHVRGYTIGPAFYWILWLVRVTLGPWFDNLPHAGGIGHAILQSGADTLLLAAVWKRTGSVWIALALIAFLVTSGFDLSVAGLIWNPVMGSILAKVAIALVLMAWPGVSPARVGITAAVAWSAVHAYTGTIFVAASVFAAMLLEPFRKKDWQAFRKMAAIIVGVVVFLQLPYVIHRFTHRSSEAAMEAVTGSLRRLATGSDAPEFSKSVSGYVASFSFIQGVPRSVPAAGWILLLSAVIVAVKHARDPVLLSMALLPQALAIVGYALFLGTLDSYYYFSLMPPIMLTIVLAATALPGKRLQAAMAIVLLCLALAAAPARFRVASTLLKMPEYAVLVDGSRKMAKLKQPMRMIETEFTLPPTSDPLFVYRILGGQIDRNSPWVGRITNEGEVVYRKVEP